MGKLLNLLVFLLFVLFIAGVGWLGFKSYEYMKNQTPNTQTAMAHDESVKENKAVFDSEDPNEWDKMDDEDEEDLLEDEDADDVMEEDEMEEEIKKADKAEEKLLKENKVKETFTEKGAVAKKVLPAEKKNTPAAKPKTSGKSANDVATAKREIPTEYNKTVNMSPGGAFLVIAGSFTIAENAEKEAVALRKKGYPNAETVQFASTKYLSVCTGRFKSKKEALEMVAKLKKNQKIEAYVHKRRMK